MDGQSPVGQIEDASVLGPEPPIIYVVDGRHGHILRFKFNAEHFEQLLDILVALDCHVRCFYLVLMSLMNNLSLLSLLQSIQRHVVRLKFAPSALIVHLCLLLQLFLHFDGLLFHLFVLMRQQKSSHLLLVVVDVVGWTQEAGSWLGHEDEEIRHIKNLPKNLVVNVSSLNVNLISKQRLKILC
jgi:hypothetical protein